MMVMGREVKQGFEAWLVATAHKHGLTTEQVRERMDLSMTPFNDFKAGRRLPPGRIKKIMRIIWETGKAPEFDATEATRYLRKLQAKEREAVAA